MMKYLFLSILLLFKTLFRKHEHSLPNEVTHPTMSAPALLVLSAASFKVIPPTPIILMSINPVLRDSSEDKRSLNVMTFPNASVCRSSPPTPPKPVGTGKTGSQTSSNLFCKNMLFPRVFVQVKNEKGFFPSLPKVLRPRLRPKTDLDKYRVAALNP
ncbi:hypothetical protein BJ165DRAFT_1433262, partial [Panaeolus papilionaceus]